jgi:hypothetical protein
MKTIFLALLIILGATHSHAGEVQQWKLSQGGNGHYYRLIVPVNGITWEDARTAAANAGGYLATITSEEEKAFVLGMAAGFSVDNYAYTFLGGTQTPGSGSPATGWTWVTGEPFSYAPWASGEPNDAGGLEDRLMMWVNAWHSGRLNDCPNIVEARFPCSYIIESEEPTGVWLPSMGGNGHRYEVLPPTDRLTWTEAQSRAQSRGGYLATITSQEENSFVTSQLPLNYFNWIGGVQANLGNITWEWGTGEAWSYTNWSPGNPNYPGIERYLQIYGHQAEDPGTWNNATNDSQGGGGLFGYVVEYSTPISTVPPHYTQGSGAAWANDRLLGSPSPDNTIRKYGCFIASTSIILNSYGHTTDPGKLNQFLSQIIPSDYGILALGSIPASDSYGQTDGAKGIPVAFHSRNFPQAFSKAQILSLLESRIAESGPVLLRVPQYNDGLEHFPAWTHAIVAWRSQDNQIFIRNPGSLRSGISSERNIDSLTLDDYIDYVNSSVSNLSFRLDFDYQFLLGRMYTYARAITNSTAFTARGAVHSPIEFVITDPLGRRVGFNPVIGQEFQEIPSSLYERISFIITPDGELMPSEGAHGPIDFEIGSLVEGTYTLDVFGVGSGEWSFNLGVNDASGFNPKQVNFSGIASNGSISQYTFQIAKPSLALKNIAVTPSNQGQAPAITGRILGGVANSIVYLQASTDLGQADPWTTLRAIQLNEYGNGSFTDVKDARPAALNASSDFFRIMHDP